MKSRFAVSFLFILIASTFTSDAIADLKKLSSWTSETYRCLAVDVLRQQAHMRSLIFAVRGANYHGAPFDSVQVSTRQIRETVDLMGIW